MTGEQLALWCKRGHLMNDDNTRLGCCGEPQCRECLRIHLAAVRRRARDGKADMSKCPSCRHPVEGKHWVSCKANRCARCQRAPRLVGAYCGFCLKEVRREREQVVAEKLLRLDRDDDE
jgi:hypothetical protein